MKLEKVFIQYWLSRQMAVEEHRAGDPEQTFGRPVFYQPGMVPKAGDLVIAGQADLPWLSHAEDVLILSIGRPGLSMSSPVLSVAADVAPARLFNCLQEIFDRFDSWERQMLELCAGSEASYRELVDGCDSIILDPFCVVDKDFNVVAYSRLSHDRGLVAESVDENNRIRREFVFDLVNSAEYPELIRSRDTYIYEWKNGDGGKTACRNLYYGDELIGIMHTAQSGTDPMVNGYSYAVARHVCRFLQLMYQRRLSFDNNSLSASTFKVLLVGMLGGIQVTGPQWNQLLLENGWRPTDLLRLIRLAPSLRHNKKIYSNHLSATMEDTWKGVICFEYQDTFYLLLNQTQFPELNGSEFRQEFVPFIRDNLLVAGLSREFRGAEALRSAHIQTRIALEEGTPLSPTAWLFEFDDYALEHLLKCGVSELEPEQICSKKLLKLKEYDQANGTRYFDTVEMFIRCRMNATETAKQLYIQRSSFLYRMERIAKLADIDFDNYDEVVYLLLSCRLLRHK